MSNTFFQNTCKPEGFGGKLMVNMMNNGHAPLAEWGMQYAPLSNDSVLLDIGCGGGANIAEFLLRCPDGKVNGIDYSEVSVAKAGKKNQKAIKEGRCVIQQGEVSALPFAEKTFDLVSAFETVYFWPDIENDFRQVFKVLRSGATFLLCNESDGLDSNGKKWETIIDGMKIYTVEQLTEILTKAGFNHIAVHHNPQKHWMCITAEKE